MSNTLKLVLSVLALVVVTNGMVSTVTATDTNLCVLIAGKADILNEELGMLKEDHPILSSLFGDQMVALHTDDGQTVGLKLTGLNVEEIFCGEPDNTTVDIYASIDTVKSIKTWEEFLKGWRDGRIKVIFRNPVSDHPLVSYTLMAMSFLGFGVFYYFTGSYHSTKRVLFAMSAMLGLTRHEGKGEIEIATERMLIRVIGWEGKGYKPEKGYARLLIGHSYLLNCQFIPLKEFRHVKLKLRYDDSKLKIADDVCDTGLPTTKTYAVSTRSEALPELQFNATDFILIDAEWEDGVKEEGIIRIPVVINRYICDGIPYAAGNTIKWLGGILGSMVLLANTISLLISIIIRYI